jgi:hypothetical protein
MHDPLVKSREATAPQKMVSAKKRPNSINMCKYLLQLIVITLCEPCYDRLNRF